MTTDDQGRADNVALTTTMTVGTDPERVTVGIRDGAKRTLSAAERAQYDEQGFTIVPDVFPPHELEEIDGEIDRLLEKLLAERRERGEARGNGHHEDTGSILQLGLRSPV